MKGRYRHTSVLIALMLCCSVSQSWGQGADNAERILFNAKVFTGVADHPYAEAVAIRGDKIVAVGNLAEVSHAAGQSAERIDLSGKTLLPGLIDSHANPIDGGFSLVSVDLGDQLESMDELVKVAADAKKSGKGMRGDVLYVGGMPITAWSKLDDLNV